jgi:hypothetical protein
MVEATPMTRACALALKDMKADGFTDAKDISLYHLFGDVLELAAIEVMNGRAIPSDGMKLTPGVLVLNIDFSEPAGEEWTFFIDECEEGNFGPSIVWPADARGNRGIFHAALAYRMRSLVDELRATDTSRVGEFLMFIVGIKDISAHTRIKLEQTRNDLVKLYTQRKTSSPQSSPTTGPNIPDMRLIA